MARQTFLNLSESRREEILMTAYEEFAIKGYDAASVSNIIKKLKLAKGSFYRYFGSKKDLFAYLVKDSTSRRLKNLDDLLVENHDDFFKLIEDNFMNKVKFDLEFPTIGGFLARIMQENGNKQIKEIIDSLYERVFSAIKELITNKYFKVQLGAYDTDLLAFTIFNSQLGLYTFISKKYSIDYEEKIRNKKPILSLPQNELKKLIAEQTNILKNGIKANNK